MGDEALKNKTKLTSDSDMEKVDVKQVDVICEPFKGLSGSTIPILQRVQDHYGYLSRDIVERVAENMNKSAHQIYGVLTFYSQFHTSPRGKYVIRVCRGTACHVKGSLRISQIVAEEFNISNGETSEDLKFTLEEVSCIGACGMAPVIMVNDKTYGNLTPEEARKILIGYAKKDV